MKGPKSLVRRLLAWFLIPYLGILILVVLLVYSRANTTLRETIFDKLESVADVKGQTLNGWVEGLLKQVVVIAETFSFYGVGDIQGDDPARREAVRADIEKILESVLENQPSIEEIALLSSVGGEVLLSTTRENIGKHFVYNQYYVEGKRGPHIQEVYPSPETLKPTLTLSAPVYHRDGSLAGVVAAHLALDYLDGNILQQQGLGSSGVVTLVDQHKIFITGQRYGQLNLRTESTSQAIEEVVQGRNGFGVYQNLDGREVLGVYHWLPRRNLGLIVEMDADEALASARRLTFTLIWVGSLFLLLLTAATLLISRRVARPILAISRAAVAVRDGELAARAPISTRDEIGVLANSFNQMVGQLEEKVRELEDFQRRQRLALDALEANNKELATAEATLKSKNDELEQFNYTVSHDLRNPLLTIKGFLGYVQDNLDRGDMDKARADLSHVVLAADKMSLLLNDLLELSRVGRTGQKLETVPLLKLCQETANAVQRQSPNLEITIADDLPDVYGNPVSLEEVVDNLLNNAVKFMGDQESPRIEIGHRLDDGETVIFFKDNGIGVDPRYREKIFGLFERLNSSIDGTGVGLAIVQKIIEFHRGRIWVESEGLGRGSTFCWTLGLAPANFPGVEP